MHGKTVINSGELLSSSVESHVMLRDDDTCGL